MSPPTNEPIPSYLYSLGYRKRGLRLHNACFWRMAVARGWMEKQLEEDRRSVPEAESK